MIQKSELQSILSKYHLNGLVETVKWEIKDKQLNIKFTNQTKEMIGELEISNFNFPDAVLGISNTSQLVKLISITSGELQTDIIKNQKIATKLILADSNYTVNYSLADMLTIPKAGSYNGSNQFNLETPLELETINSIIKAKSALPDSNVVVIKPSTDFDNAFQLELVFGGDIEYANKVSLFLRNFIQNEVPSNFELRFNSELLKEILLSNKDADKANLFIKTEGLMKLEFTTSTIKSIYYLVQNSF